VYDYASTDGSVAYRVGRTGDKQFPTAHLDPRLGWIWGYPPYSMKVLFNLPAVLDGVQRGTRIFVVEGEKDAENLNGAFSDRIDYVATTKLGGARSLWLPQYSAALRGAAVWIVADKDHEGTHAAAAAARGLVGVAKEIVIVEAAEGKDASDHIGAGLGLADFVLVAADWPVTMMA
jgi:5S rRNA maturation endonuclease (ribonuclease M5)